MRTVLLATCIALIAAPALAQDGSFSNPSPIDFTQPFLFDGIGVGRQGTLIQGVGEERATSVETTTREDLLNRGSPTAAEFVRGLSEVSPPRPTCIRYERDRWIEEGRPDLTARLRELSAGGRCVTVDFSEHTAPPQ